ncbi:MAG: VOC family protein [Acidimicrobiia bacterium]|nr:VOC family protein [Acidimicrobiia bacterium]NNF68339.1 VOC family protein [Acidimicrobiia bacterium]
MLCVPDAAAAIAFYCEVFDAPEIFDRHVDEAGKVGHAEVLIGDSPVWIVDEYPEYDIHPPRGPAPVQMIVYVPDVDSVFDRAIAAGATVYHPPTDMPYGERNGRFDDPFGYRWSIRMRH